MKKYLLILLALVHTAYGQNPSYNSVTITGTGGTASAKVTATGTGSSATLLVNGNTVGGVPITNGTANNITLTGSTSLLGTGSTANFSFSGNQYTTSNEFVISNNLTGVGNVMAIQPSGSSTFSAISFRTMSGTEVAAIGAGLNNTISPFNGSVYMESSVKTGVAAPMRFITTTSGTPTLQVQIDPSAGFTSYNTFTESNSGTNTFVLNGTNVVVSVPIVSTVAGTTVLFDTTVSDVLGLQNNAANSFCDIRFRSNGGSNKMFIGYVNTGVSSPAAGMPYMDVNGNTFMWVSGNNTLGTFTPTGTIGNLAITGTYSGNGIGLSGVQKTLVVITGTLVSGTAIISDSRIASNNTWAQDRATSITNLGSLAVSVSGTVATVRSSSVLDTSAFDLFIAP